ARELAWRGYQVTVFEEMPEPGGMLRYGIPAYRLPRDIIKAEIDAILALGVELHCQTRVGRDISWEELRRTYNAVYLAIGAHRSLKLGVDGEDLQGVIGAVEFLRQVNLADAPPVGRNVAVIGGGNSAIDAARSALRLGAKQVTIIYRRLREDMPAQEEEIHAAEEEGIKIQYLAAPVRFTGDEGQVRQIVCQRMTLGEFDRSGRRRPVPVPGAEFILEADQVIAAVSQQPVLPFPTDNGLGIKVSKGGLIQLRPGTKTLTGEAMVFAGGDTVTGPSTVIWAIAAGRNAAREIDMAIRVINGEPPYVPPLSVETLVPLITDEELKEPPQAVMPELEPEVRMKQFVEVELGFSPQVAMGEACRCLRCDIKPEDS
ncbi:MAG: FAD-dependent oxidoreductase, partial [Deltaproteobacteria bacterium]|nr:FAD-dependent oxidoreductase [Deltaproteobacteria bacterium]